MSTFRKTVASLSDLPDPASMLDGRVKYSSTVVISRMVDNHIGAAQVSTIAFTGLDQDDVANKYFLLTGETGLFYVWFNVDDGGTDPAVAGATGVEVTLGASADAAAIATAVAAALDAEEDFGATADTATVTITDAEVGRREPIDAGDSTATVAVTTWGYAAGPAARWLAHDDDLAL